MANLWKYWKGGQAHEWPAGTDLPAGAEWQRVEFLNQFTEAIRERYAIAIQMMAFVGEPAVIPDVVRGQNVQVASLYNSWLEALSRSAAGSKFFSVFVDRDVLPETNDLRGDFPALTDADFSGLLDPVEPGDPIQPVFSRIRRALGKMKVARGSAITASGCEYWSYQTYYGIAPGGDTPIWVDYFWRSQGPIDAYPIYMVWTWSRSYDSQPTFYRVTYRNIFTSAAVDVPFTFQPWEVVVALERAVWPNYWDEFHDFDNIGIESADSLYVLPNGRHSGDSARRIVTGGAGAANPEPPPIHDFVERPADPYSFAGVDMAGVVFFKPGFKYE